MKQNTLFILFLFSFLFLQCRTTPVGIVKKRVWHATDKFFNFQWFKTCRNLMLNTFSSDVMENDSIIILEYFTATFGNYSCTIYESKDHSCRRYIASRSIKNNKIVVDSLETTNYKDYILPMVLKGELDEIIEKGENSHITPPSTLIISILKKTRKERILKKRQ